jgi:hypothetical protein
MEHPLGDGTPAFALADRLRYFVYTCVRLSTRTNQDMIVKIA